MRNLRLYNTDAAFKANEQAAGSDGSKTVTVVPGVSLSKDLEKSYFNPARENTSSMTITQYYYISGTSRQVAPIKEVKVRYVTGTTSEVTFRPKTGLEYYTPFEAFKTAEIPIDTSVTFNYGGKKLFHEAVYSITDTTAQTKLFNTAPAGVTHIEIDGAVYPKTTTSFTFSTEGRHVVKYFLWSAVTQNTMAGYMFSGVTALESIELCDGVTGLTNWCFSGCTGLISVKIPDSVIHFGDGCFNYCYRLTGVTIPSGVTAIGDYCFNICSSCTVIDIPDSVTSIGNYVFLSCKGLKEIYIGNGVTGYVNNNCFGRFTVIGNTYGMHGTGNESGTCFYPQLEKIVYGNKVRGTIPNDFFRTCKNLKEVIIGDSITSIGASAFSFCTSLEKVTIGTGVTSIGSYAFNATTNLSSLTVTDSVTNVYSFTFGSYSTPYEDFVKNGLVELYLGTGITSFCDYLLAGSRKLKKLTLTSPTVVNMTDPVGRLTGSFRETLWDYQWWNNGKQYGEPGKIYVPSNLLETYRTTSAWDELVNEYGDDVFQAI